MLKRLLAFSLIASLLALTSAKAKSDYALIIEGQTVSLTEANIYIINAEQAYSDIASYYEEYLGVDYWALTYANGMTVSQMVKSDVFDQIKAMNIFYAMALENGMRLTEGEKEACRKDAESAYQALSVTDSEKIDLDALCLVYEKQLLADRMYSVCLDGVHIDEEAVYASVSSADYLKYDVEYLFRSFDDFDENGRQHPLTHEKRSAIENVFQSAASFSSLEEAASLNESLDILYGKTAFLSSDASVDHRLIEAASALEIGALSGIIETDLGLFLIRLLDNTDTSAYESAIGEKLFSAKEEAFLEEKTELVRKCEYEINVSVWRTLTPGANENIH
ncbi:MAG: peptidyl-prolyl cis-trans isomerase [Clostridiales bacterium]|nr:peptidyl-prolyl cis-trans isomerase [Clostridiales bacterium]